VNGRLLLCIGMGVFVIHLGIFMILSHLRGQPPPPTPPNFKVRSQVLVDRETGEKTVYRDITVSTKLGTPAPTPAAKPVLAATERQPLHEPLEKPSDEQRVKSEPEARRE